MMRDRSKSKLYTVPYIVRLKYAYATHRRLVWCIATLVALTAICTLPYISGLIWNWLTQPASGLPSNPGYIGFVGVLLGAIIGAFVTGGVSYWLHLGQYRANAMIHKKIEIFDPLYDALVKLDAEIRDLPLASYPPSYSLEAKSINPDFHFGVWIAISRSNRYISVPLWLRASLDHFCQLLDYQNECINQAGIDIECQVTKLLTERFHFEQSVPLGSGRIILRSIGTDWLFRNKLTMIFGDKFANNMDPVYRDNITLTILNYSEQIPSVQEVLELQKTIELRLKWLSEELYKVIRYVELLHMNNESGF